MVKGWWEASELPFLFPIQKKNAQKQMHFQMKNSSKY